MDKTISAVRKNTWLFSARADIAFFALSVAFIFLLRIPTLGKSIFTIKLVLFTAGMAHVTATLLPVFFDANVFSQITSRQWLTITALILTTIAIFFVSPIMYLVVFHFYTLHHTIMQQYGFVRITHRKSADSPSLKLIELSFFFLFILIGIVYWHLGLSHVALKLVHSRPIVLPFHFSQIAHLKYWILGGYLSALLSFLFTKFFVFRTDNLSSLILILNSHSIFLLLLLFSKSVLIFLIAMRLSHDFPYLYLIRKQWAKSPNYFGWFKNKKRVLVPVSFVAGLALLLQFFNLYDQKLSPEIPTLIYVLAWTPSVFHYLVDGIIWKKNFQLRV